VFIEILNLVTFEYNRQSIFNIFSEIQKKINLILDHQYGQITISNNSTIISVPAAVDTTLATNSDYVQITGIWSAIPHGFNNGVTQQTNSFTINKTGVYRIEMWANVTSNQNNNNIAVRFARNGVITLIRRPRAFISSANDRLNMAAFGYAELTAGDVLTLWIASDKTSNVTIEDLVFSTEGMRMY